MSTFNDLLDSIEQYTKARREDLAEKESLELAIVEEYLPQQLSDGEIEAIVKAKRSAPTSIAVA